MHGLRWVADLPDLYVATRDADCGPRLHLSAELLPFGGWEWLAWRGDDSGRCLRGEAGDRTSAMLAAEQGALLLGFAAGAGRCRTRDCVTAP